MDRKLSWHDLIETGDETVTLPWLGGNSLRSRSRQWAIEGVLPVEHGWYRFQVRGRRVQDPQRAEAKLDELRSIVKGYLVGNRMISDGATGLFTIDSDPRRIVKQSETVHLLEDGLDRFVRVAAGRAYADGPLVYIQQEMPLGPEAEVLEAFLNQQPTVAGIKGVAPALEAAFRMECFQREEAERRRRELEQRRREEEERRRQEEERRQREDQRRQLIQRLGDGAGRRAMARVDFTEAARSALAVGGAELLDSKRGRGGEYTIRYRLDGQRFECLCDANLRIIDAGICLIDHDNDERGDTYFTLESLPAVVQQARREGKLVVFRHV
jgi:hypothetical protein